MSSSETVGKVGPALLGLAGVVTGLVLNFEGCWPRVICAGIGALALVLLALGRGQMTVHPVLGRWLIEIWVVSAVLAGAVATWLLVAVLLDRRLDDWLTAKHVLKDSAKPVAELVTGAISSVIAAALTKEVGEGVGPFAVATQFKAAMLTAGKTLAPPNDTQVHEALFADYVRGTINGDLGWGFKARGQRAQIVKGYLP